MPANFSGFAHDTLFYFFQNSLVCEADIVPDNAVTEVGLEVDVEGGALGEHLVLEREVGPGLVPNVVDPVAAHFGVTTI